MNNTTKKPPEKIIISPEGVEERVELEYTLRITLTAGGKYRIYVPSGNFGECEPLQIAETLPEAKVKLGEKMTIVGMMLIDPVGTVNSLLASFKKK